MWPFKKKISSLRESGMFEGFTDWHSHILPGVDDGIKTMEDALAVLRTYENLGFKRVWLTPHIMEDYPNDTSELRQKYENLKRNWDGNLDIRLASENMLDSLFERRLEDNDFLPIGDNGSHLLVETSYFTPPFGMDEMLENISKAGYFPVLAHPERYRYMEETDYRRYKEMGLLFQLNFLSLVGAYGKDAQKKAEWLINQDFVEVMGSDVHRISSVINAIEISPKSSNLVQKINKIAHAAFI